jgi:uncharacterized membrane protein
MKPRDFLKQLDETKVVRAIQEAEGRTSGEVRVFVTSEAIAGDDAFAHAADRFEKLGMAATRERNAVLLYFAPRSHQFAIIGDQGVHEKFGDALWQGIVSSIREKLLNGHVTEAVADGIAMVGEALAHHFPRRSDDRNELPDTIERD